jgi:hypothetical protein
MYRQVSSEVGVSPIVLRENLLVLASNPIFVSVFGLILGINLGVNGWGVLDLATLVLPVLGFGDPARVNLVKGRTITEFLVQHLGGSISNTTRNTKQTTDKN